MAQSRNFQSRRLSIPIIPRLQYMAFSLTLGTLPETPDMGTTVSLFGFAIAGLAFFRRKLPQ